MGRNLLPVSVALLLLASLLLAGCVRPGSVQILICVKNRSGEAATVETVLLDLNPDAPADELVSFEKSFQVGPGELLRTPTTIRNGYYLMQAVAVDGSGKKWEAENGPTSYGARFRENGFPIHVIILGQDTLTVDTMNRSCAEL